MPTINAGVWRSENGSAPILTPSGGSAYTISNRVQGSVKYKLPSRERFDIINDSAMELPLEGNDTSGEFEAEFKIGEVGSTSIATLLSTTGSTTTGRAKGYSWSLPTLAARGGSTAKTVTISNFWLEAGGLNVEHGIEFDKISVKGKFLGYAEA